MICLLLNVVLLLPWRFSVFLDCLYAFIPVTIIWTTIHFIRKQKYFWLLIILDLFNFHHLVSCSKYLFFLSFLLLWTEVEGLSMQYWIASASCFGVLIFFCLALYCSAKNTGSFQLRSSEALKYGLLQTVLYVAVCSLSLTTKSDSG